MLRACCLTVLPVCEVVPAGNDRSCSWVGGVSASGSDWLSWPSPGALNNGTFVFELAYVAATQCAAIVVEDRFDDLLKHAHPTAGVLPEMLGRVHVRSQRTRSSSSRRARLPRSGRSAISGQRWLRRPTRAFESQIRAVERTIDYGVVPLGRGYAI